MVFRKIADEYVLVPIRREAADLEKIYTLNDVGAFVWEQIDGERTVRQIVDLLAEEYEVSAEQAEGDVIEYVELLSEIGAVVLC